MSGKEGYLQTAIEDPILGLLIPKFEQEDARMRELQRTQDAK